MKKPSLFIKFEKAKPVDINKLLTLIRRHKQQQTKGLV